MLFFSLITVYELTLSCGCNIILGRCADDKPFVPTYQVSQEKTRSLGIDYVPLETSLKETIESLREKGFVTF